MFAGEYLAQNYRGKRIGVVHDGSKYGQGLASDVQRTLGGQGANVVVFEQFQPGQRSYASLVAKLKRAKADVVFCGCYHTEAGLIVRQMRSQGMRTVMVGGDALVTNEYASITGKSGDGTLMTFVPDPRVNPAARDIVKRFRDTGKEPEGYVIFSYLAIQVWAQAVERAQSADARLVAAELKKGQFTSVLGSLGFDSKGDVTLPGYAMYRWSRGSYAQVQ